MIDQAPLWADPRLTYTVAAFAVLLLVAAIWLFGRKKRQGRQAGVICLSISIVLHLALITLVPKLPAFRGKGAPAGDATSTTEEALASFQFFDPDTEASAAKQESTTVISPLPISNLDDLLGPTDSLAGLTEADTPIDSDSANQTETTSQTDPQKTAEESADTNSSSLDTLAMESLIPPDLSDATQPSTTDSASADSSLASNMSAQLDALLEAAFTDNPSKTPLIPDSPREVSPQNDSGAIAKANPPRSTNAAPSQFASSKSGPTGAKNESPESAFANRSGEAKTTALQQTGGSEETEAAVASALRYLAQTQQANGSWNPQTTGAGVERAPLGVNRHGAGGRSETAITGLALLAMIGAGNTHQHGKYADNVYRGLAFLINSQSRVPQSIGSLAGANTSVYSATYSHGIAALAMCEAAAITRDASALVSAQRAINYTMQMQIPATGGWRYTRYDRDGDLSQLGWQAMVLDAGHRAKLPVKQQTVNGIQRFLRSVRAGRGGLASYRPREAPTRTMTAEALATRLLIGENVPAAEIAEAETYLLQQPPGVGADNYYYWYYATLALHQLQDDAWLQWNTALKRRLLSTQRPDGRWSSNTVWGGYGGEIYTTSMATLCLETYYRHAIRKNKARIATRPPTQTFQR